MTTEQNTNQSSEQKPNVTVPVYYWHDGYWTTDTDERQMSDDWDLYGGLAQVIALPENWTQQQVSMHIANLCMQPHADTPRVGSEHPARGVCGSDNDIPH